MLPRRGILRHEDVPLPRARQRSASEVHRALEATGYEHTARAVRRDRHARVVAAAPEPLGPEVLARRRVLHQEHVGQTDTEERSPAEVHAPRAGAYVPGHEDIAGSIRRDRIALVVAEPTHRLRPGPGPCRGVLGDEDVGAAMIELRPAAVIHRVAALVAGDENVAARIGGHALA